MAFLFGMAYLFGLGMCMEKFEDSPIIYENFAEAIWAVRATPAIDSSNN